MIGASFQPEGSIRFQRIALSVVGHGVDCESETFSFGVSPRYIEYETLQEGVYVVTRYKLQL